METHRLPDHPKEQLLDSSYCPALPAKVQEGKARPPPGEPCIRMTWRAR